MNSIFHVCPNHTSPFSTQLVTSLFHHEGQPRTVFSGGIRNSSCPPASFTENRWCQTSLLKWASVLTQEASVPVPSLRNVNRDPTLMRQSPACRSLANS